MGQLEADRVYSAPLQPVPVGPLGDVRVSCVREEPATRTKMRFVTVRSGRIVLRFVYGPINEKAAFPKEIDTVISTFVKKAEAKPVK